jgi:hypothetical protein
MSSKKSLRPADRASALALRQTLKMARSAHAYVRGSTVQFYEWLEAQKRGTLPKGRRCGFAAIAMSAISGRSQAPTDVLPSKFAISTRP